MTDNPRITFSTENTGGMTSVLYSGDNTAFKWTNLGNNTIEEDVYGISFTDRNTCKSYDMYVYYNRTFDHATTSVTDADQQLVRT